MKMKLLKKSLRQKNGLMMKIQRKLILKMTGTTLMRKKRDMIPWANKMTLLIMSIL
jgi:hypothetical protein